jgi:hypothetical protein
LYYKWADVEKSNPVDVAAKMKMEIGNVTHELITKWLRGAKLEIADEIAVQKRYSNLRHPISVRIDNVFVDKSGEKEKFAGVEVKTSFGYGILAIKKAGFPKYDHLMQTLLYQELTGINEFYILYIGRDFAYRTQFGIKKIRGGQNEYDLSTPRQIEIYPSLPSFRTKIRLEYYFDRVVKKMEQTEKHNCIALVPERDYSIGIKNGKAMKDFTHNKVKYKSDWRCMWCEWRDLCWQKELAEYNTLQKHNYDDFKPKGDEIPDEIRILGSRESFTE